MMVAIAKENSYDSIYINTLKQIFKTPFFRNYHHLIASRILKSNEKIICESILPRYNRIIYFIIENIYLSDYPPNIKIKYYNYYYSEIELKVGYYELCRFNRLVVDDDGLYHNTTLSYDLSNDFKVLSEFRNTSYFPDAVIFCDIDLETNYKRRIIRANSNDRTFVETNLTNIELKQLCEKSIYEANFKRRLLTKLDIPLLELNMTQSIETNYDKVVSFIIKYGS